MAKSCYLCLAETSSDQMTYFILTEADTSKATVLVWFVICSCHKHVGEPNKHVNNDLAYESFYFSDDEDCCIINDDTPSDFSPAPSLAAPINAREMEIDPLPGDMGD